ncbi:hypothetical protein FJ949_23710 [Mesorhizobium sp. B2-4-1]|nr:hypothetical protein FJ947_22650 [Mesorhizobium sp. B2-4-8]TPL61144.1 hypothetical protein FJ949_23710 [Mesorhizobium sp. B2-4-1]
MNSSCPDPYKPIIRLDPVKIRVALPAADPPDHATETIVNQPPGRRQIIRFCGTSSSWFFLTPSDVTGFLISAPTCCRAS